VQAERLGVELIGVTLPILHQFPDTVHVDGVDAVEVERVGMRSQIGEVDADAVALGGAQGRARYLAVVGPGGEVDPRRNLDFLVKGNNRVLAQRLAIVELAHLAVVEVDEVGRGIESTQVRIPHSPQAEVRVVGIAPSLLTRRRRLGR